MLVTLLACAVEKMEDDMPLHVKQDAREFCFELETHAQYSAIATRYFLQGGQLV